MMYPRQKIPLVSLLRMHRERYSWRIKGAVGALTALQDRFDRLEDITPRFGWQLLTDVLSLNDAHIKHTVKHPKRNLMSGEIRTEC